MKQTTGSSWERRLPSAPPLPRSPPRTLQKCGKSRNRRPWHLAGDKKGFILERRSKEEPKARRSTVLKPRTARQLSTIAGLVMAKFIVVPATISEYRVSHKYFYYFSDFSFSRLLDCSYATLLLAFCSLGFSLFVILLVGTLAITMNDADANRDEP
jgi:hypothetical protein